MQHGSGAAAGAGAAPDWSLSIVSHGHGEGVRELLGDCARWLAPERFEILLTLNAGETIDTSPWPGALRQLHNASPRGFAANHNAALAGARGQRVAMLDPDLRLRGDPFAALAALLDERELRIVAPRVVDDRGALQDNARHLLTPASLLRRYVLRRSEARDAAAGPLRTDWIAGLFMAMRRDTFQRLGGFNAEFFLYCEDAELSLRCWNAGGEVWVTPAGAVVHVARRRTLKNRSHFLWHCASLARLWTSRPYWMFLRRRR